MLLRHIHVSQPKIVVTHQRFHSDGLYHILGRFPIRAQAEGNSADILLRRGIRRITIGRVTNRSPLSLAFLLGRFWRLFPTTLSSVARVVGRWYAQCLIPPSLHKIATLRNFLSRPAAVLEQARVQPQDKRSKLNARLVYSRRM
jgi:hypothetical protein